MSSKPSLKKPDFSGLWSYATLGGFKEKKWYSKFLGGFSLLFILICWVGGLLSPLFILFLLYKQYYTFSSFIIFFTIYPFIIDIYPNFFITRLYFWACHYFDGGCTIAFEENPYDIVVYDDNNNNPLSNNNNNNNSNYYIDIDKRPPILFCCHPHGVFTVGYLYNTASRITAALDYFATDLNIIHNFLGKFGDVVRKIYLNNLSAAQINANNEPNMSQWIKENSLSAYRNIPNVGLVTPILLKTPFFSWFVGKYTLALAGANKDSVIDIMEERRSFCVTPGGFYEAAFFERKKEFVYLKNVKGFIKYALQYGYHVIPAYAFGESYTYWNWKGHPALKKWLCDHKLPAILAHGPYWWCPLLPYSDTGIHTIYSKGKIFPKIEQPTAEQIAEYHEWYTNELKGLFDRNKWRFGMNSVELEII